MLTPLTDLLAHDGFRTGVALGVPAAVVVAVAALLARRAVPVAGLAFGAATVVGFRARFTLEADVVVALVVLAAGGYVTGSRGWLLRLAACAPGALWLALATGPNSPGWAVPAIVAVTLVGGVLAGDLDRSLAADGLGPALLPVTMLGLYLTTPDTEHSAILLGAALPVALLGVPRALAPLGAGGAAVAAALVGWDVVLDGVGRDGAVVGGVACLGMYVIEPVVRRVTGRQVASGAAGAGRPRRDAVVVAALHVGVVAACSRIAGLRSSAVEALAICVVVYVVAAALLVRGAGRPADRPLTPAWDRPPT